jgi:hypothetical protein
MSNKPHRIGKQIFEAVYHSGSNGLVFRQEFTELVKRSLLSVIEEVFEALDPNEAVLRLEKVELELNNIAYPFEEENIKSELRKSLRDELNFRIVSIRHRKQHTIHSEESILPVKRLEEELLLFFVQYGLLPWWSSESKNHVVSIQELIQRLSISEPKAIYRVLEKVKNNREQIRRFCYHCSESTLIIFITSNSEVSAATLEAFTYSFKQTGIAAKIPQLDIVFKEFVILHFVLEKNKVQPLIGLQTDFIEYMLQKKYLKEYQLPDLFPDYMIIYWLKYHFSAGFIFFQEYLKNMEIYKDDATRKRMHSIVLQSLLKHKLEGDKDILTELTKKLSNIDIEFKKVFAFSDPISEISFQLDKKTEQYFKVVEKKILQYLLYGIFSWEDRAMGVAGIESLFLTLHEEAPERLKIIISQIELKSYPSVLRIVERSFDKFTSDVFFNFYFSKGLALKQLASAEYKDKILKTFFEKGLAPWEEIIGNNIQETERIIQSFYEQDPDYFVKVLKILLQKKSGFIEKAESLYSSVFINFLKEVIKNRVSEFELKQEEKVTIEVISRDVDLIIYYLNYFEQNKKISPEVVFTLTELVKYFVDHFPEQARLYFTVAAHQEYDILKQNFPADILSKIEGWIRSDYSDKEQIKAKTEKRKATSLDETKPLELKEPIYITNAGLVLIHPFLQRFFSLCGLLDKRKFKDEKSKHKAVHLLQYIVSKEKFEEHRLVLNKILCGIPLTEPVDRTIELMEEDKETCESLIKGVVENWPILKKTSNENFRVSLLQREGRLLAEEGGWRLKVEERSYDMLLDRLPWSISMIKLPWMEKMLQVEWR